MSRDKGKTVMPVELLRDLERRTGTSGPFQHGLNQDRDTCNQLLVWLGVDRYSWERLRILLNYVHERGYRLGAERAVGTVRDHVLGGAIYRELTLWGADLTGLDMSTLSDYGTGEDRSLVGLYEAVGDSDGN